MDIGKGVAVVRKELTALIKQSKQVDPGEEGKKRHTASVKGFLRAIATFKKDAETLKLIPPQLVNKAMELFKELESELDEKEAP